jgi:flagellar hook assembly protein FlgD
VVSGERKILNVPEAFALQANYPNPFSRATHLIFGAATPLTVDVTIYDVTGRHVRTLFSGAIPAGPTMLVWDGLNHAGQRMTAGLYFVRASAETAGQKMERTIKVNLLF